jgi:hypothetical protein
MNKAKMRNVLERNKLEEDQMLILMLFPPSQRRPPQQHVAAVALRTSFPYHYVSKLAIFSFFFFGSFATVAVAPSVVDDGYYRPLLFIR